MFTVRSKLLIAQRSVGIGRRVAKMHIQAVPMRWGTGDNYAYIVSDDATKESVVIDPAEAHEVLPVIEKQSGLKFVSIYNTHHHYDHAGGNEEMIKALNVPVTGGKDCQSVSTTPKDRSTWSLGQNISIQAFYTPCHTQDSICYAFTDSKTGQRAVFTGDTLFTAGCGRFFEGTADEMVKAMDTLASLPKDTVVYPGHEYTRGNIKFARTVVKNSAMDKLIEFASNNEHTTGKFTIGDELEFNPFMLTASEQIQKQLGVSSKTDAMAKLREMKNNM